MYCTVKYNGKAKGVPPHLQAVFRMKGFAFVDGEAVEVPAIVAGRALKSVVPGALEVLEGEPVFPEAVTASAKAAMKKAEDHRATFPVDPARALDSVVPLPKKVVDAVLADGATKYVGGLTLDDRLADIALFCKLAGRTGVSKAAARRAAALKGSEKPTG